MSSTVHEILSLKKFNSFRLIAGANGLNRRVTRGGFIDHESAEIMRDIAFKHEMIFSNMPMIKDEPERITEYVDALIHAGCACFAIKTTFFKSLPEAAIELANRFNFPLLLFDETYIEELILDIDESVNIHKKLDNKRKIIKEIEDGSLNKFKIKNYAYELNPNFKKCFKVFYIKAVNDESHRFDTKLAHSILGKSSLVLPFEEIVLVIFSYLEGDFIEKDDILHSLGLNEAYYIGISDSFNELGLMDQALHQGKTALSFASYSQQNITDFKTIGIYQMLIPILDNNFVIQFYEDIIDRLIQYDYKHQSDLLQTAIAYVKCDGDIKRTSGQLYQHTNTVRYRIRKIKKVLSLEMLEGMRYETLSIAIHLYELSKKQNIIHL